MRVIWHLIASFAATSVSVTSAQLAKADNATMPTSRFMTRPQSFAPVLNITQSGAFSHGYIFIGPYQHPASGPYIYDKFGNLVWDGFGVVGAANAHDFKNGYGVGQGLIIDSNYKIVANVQTGRDAMPADMHEFQLLDKPSGATAIMTSYRAIPYDLSALNITTGQGWLLEGMFQEIDVQSGNVLFEWYSSNHVDVSDTQIRPNSTDISGNGFTPSTAFDYFHINAIDKSNSTGNYLVSARHTSTIYYVNATSQNIIWQLSYQGKSDFTCTNFNFSFQHDARILSESDTTTDISMFDNANNCYDNTSPESSGRFITIDHTKGTATETRRTLPPNGISSCSQGNTQLLSDGHVFQGWGDKAWISERDENDNLVFAATYTNGNHHDVMAMNYRAFNFEWQSTPANTKPSIYSFQQTDVTTNTIYVSWNGATTVATWRFYGCQQVGDVFEIIGSAPHAGFETMWTAPHYYHWVMAEALAWDNTSLANSSFQPAFIPSPALAQYCTGDTCNPTTTYAPMAARR